MARTQKNIFWFTVAGVALAIAFVVRSPYMALTIYAFVLLVGIAHFSSVAWLAGLDTKRTISNTTLQQGDETHIEVTISNERGWPIPWIFVEDPYPAFCHRNGDNTRLGVLMPGRSMKLDYTLTCPVRGYHRVGPTIMESGDLFGLQRRFRTGESQDYITVLPTIAYIDTYNVAARRPQGPIRLSNKIYEDPTRTVGLREYQPGDPLNRIHWKASARTDQLYTKIYEPSSVTGGTLILDLHEDSYVPEKKNQRIELAVTVTASIAYLLDMSGEQVGLLTNAFDAAEIAKYELEAQEVLSRGEVEQNLSEEEVSDRIMPLQVPTLKSPAQAQKISENLARVVPGHGLDMHELLLAEFRGLPRDAALLPVVPQVSETLALTFAEMKLSGFAVTVFFINNQVGFEEAQALLAPHHIHVFHITHERDLHEISPAKIGH